MIFKHRQLNIRCRCQKSVFQVKSKFPYTSSLYDIEDMLATASNMSDRDKKEYFEGHGLDVEAIDKYYQVVKSLNSTWYKSKNEFHPYSVTPWIIKLIIFYFALVVSGSRSSL